MKNATVMNDVQGIQKVLEKYIEKRKAEKVAVEISVAIQSETQYTYNGKVFYIHSDEVGGLVFTMESVVKENVQAILNSYLEEDKVQECIEQLMTGNCKTKATEFETIKIPGSDSPIYAELLKHKPETYREEDFIENLKIATSKPINEFEVFVNDPSIDGEGKLQFVPGFKPAVGYSYKELEELAKENGLRLGTKDEYILFLGWLINSLINEGWSEVDAWYAVCCDSTKLGHYFNSVNAKSHLESTGSRKVAGKCDLANAYKVFAKEKSGGFYNASGNCYMHGEGYPLVHLNINFYDDYHLNSGVGWFVL